MNIRTNKKFTISKRCIFYCFLVASIAIIGTVESKSQSIFRTPLNMNTVPQWEEYIEKYAPSDSSLRVLVELSGRYYMSGLLTNACGVYLKFMDLFPSRKAYFEGQINNFVPQMLLFAPKADQRETFEMFVKAYAPSEDAFVAVQRLAEESIVAKNWDEAAGIFKEYKPLFPDMEDRFTKIIDLLEADEEGIEIHSLGPNINTRLSEWDPSPSPDGKYLFFSASARPGSFGGEDVWYSQNVNGVWQKARNVGKSINGSNNETVDNVTVDGNGLLLSGNFQGTYGDFDIYYVNATSDGWGTMEHFPMPINSRYHDEGANFTPDGKAIIFTSDRPGGIGKYAQHGTILHGNNIGNQDIYICFKTENGWSEPVNLGPTINTPYCERSAYLHPDGKTLYFSSEGHYGLGRLDVFKSVRLREDSWTEWSEPVNLGKEINTATDDWGYKVCLSGDSAIFAGKDRPGGYGEWDIYSITLPKNLRPEKVITIQGKVTDAKGNPLEAELKWEDLSTQKNVGILRSNPVDGSYIIVLNQGKNYGYYADKSGYYPTSNNIDLRTDSDVTVINRDIILTSAKEMKETKAKIKINNIFFDYDKFDLKPESYPELDRLATFLKSNPATIVHIDGHTDNTGTQKYNLELSKHRATSVVNYLESKGLSKSSFKIQGYGQEHPIETNETEEGRSQNRRVELWFE